MAKDRKAYYRENRERILARVRARYAEKKEEIREYKRHYWLANRERLLPEQKTYADANREAINEKHRRWYEEDREKFRARTNAYRLANPDKAKAAVTAWRKANPEYVSRMKLEWQKAHYQKHPEYYREVQSRRKAAKLKTQTEKIDFKKILERSKGLCGICKKPFDLFGIHFDHIVPLSKGGTHTTDNIQAAHAHCNLVKGAKVTA